MLSGMWSDDKIGQLGFVVNTGGMTGILTG